MCVSFLEGLSNWLVLGSGKLKHQPSWISNLNLFHLNTLKNRFDNKNEEARDLFFLTATDETFGGFGLWGEGGGDDHGKD